MAEHSAVNRRVVGSSPTWGAIDSLSTVSLLFFFSFGCKTRVTGHLRRKLIGRAIHAIENSPFHTAFDLDFSEIKSASRSLMPAKQRIRCRTGRE